MKARVWIETEVEVDVSPAEVINQWPDLEHDEESKASLSAMLARCATGLFHVPDQAIALLHPQFRQMLASRLREQADRYDVKGGER